MVSEEILLVSPVAFLFPALYGLASVLRRQPGPVPALAAGLAAAATLICAVFLMSWFAGSNGFNPGFAVIVVAIAMHGPVAAAAAAIPAAIFLIFQVPEPALPLFDLAASALAGLALNRQVAAQRGEVGLAALAGYAGLACPVAAGLAALSLPDRFVPPLWAVGETALLSGIMAVLVGTLVRDQHRLRMTKRDLADAVEQLTDFVETATDWLWESDSAHRLKSLRGASHGGPMDPRKLLGRRWQDLMTVAADATADQPTTLAEDLDRHAAFRDVEIVLQEEDDLPRVIRVSGKPIFDPDGAFAGYRGSARDYTYRHRTLTRLTNAIAEAEANERRYHALAENCPLGIMQMSADGRPQYMNIAMRALLEVDTLAEFDQWSFRDRFEFRGLDPLDRRRIKSGQAQTLHEGMLIGARSQSRRNVMVNCVPISVRGTDDSQMATVIDVTERRRDEEIIRYMAQHDGLTGLPNRSTFEDRIHQAVVNARRTGRMVGILYLDLDNFKDVNDTLGHAVGDRLLCAVANRLTQRLRESDTVARLGGDEFGILATNLQNSDDAGTLSGKVSEALDDGFRVDGHDIRLTTSLGITVFPIDESTPEQLLRDAEIALYRAKDDGRNGCRFYNEAMKAEIDARKALENDLRAALENEEFSLHYQPQLDLISGQVTGAEALLRWHCPRRGTVPPNAFIPLAEATGLLVPIGEWALKEAMRQIRAWRDAGEDFFPIAVNISAVQLKHSDLRHVVGDLLAHWRLPPDCLELEVTESTIMEDLEEMTERLRGLRDLGITLAIDDFGTGHSSLANLRRFPVHKLKIDRSFVIEIAENREDSAIIEAIVRLGRSLGMTVIAEGVEASAQVGMLRRIRCDQAQGYYFTRPLPADEFVAWTHANTGLQAVGGRG